MQIKQYVGVIDPQRLGRLPALAVVCGKDFAGLRDWPGAKALIARAPKGDGSSPRCVDPAEGPRLCAVTAGPDTAAFDLLSVGRKLAAKALEGDPAELGVWITGLPDELAERSAEAIIAAVLAASHRLPSFKSKPDKPPRLSTVHLFGLNRKLDLSRTQAEAEGNALARDLTATPANHLTPKIYRQRIAAMARQQGWKFRFIGMPTLKRMGAGAFLAVAQGSPEADAGIVQLRYEPARAARKPALSLVGKGICFDTGGVNLKAARHMHGMHQDMAGSAVVLGVLLALTKLRVPYPVDCWLALAQNHIGPAAYKQNDVVRAVNGTTIEIVHTDAEGRMVLADTLAMASARKPALLIDFATLTGSCIQALGTAYSGALTNRDDLIDEVIAAGRASGERVWPFPMDADFDAQLDSDVADVKQCSMENEADHIIAARFLTRFVDKSVPWVHVDIASSANKGGLAHIPTEITGFGVRFALNFIDRQRMERP